jgi:hypothetical protein
MNYFRRRRILKQVNFLDLRPVKILAGQVRDDGGITLLLPRFKNSLSKNFFQPGSKEPFIRIRLDRFGSQAWSLIDGENTVSGICGNLASLFPEEFLSGDETESRVTKFLSRLYQERYITFREIQDELPPSTQ